MKYSRNLLDQIHTKYKDNLYIIIADANIINKLISYENRINIKLSHSSILSKKNKYKIKKINIKFS